MNAVMKTLSPNATNQIRADHTHVLSTFHKYKADTAPQTKLALVKTICLALEVHAQLEEQVFYSAVRELDPNGSVISKSVPEHDEMRRLIDKVRAMEPGDAGYDDTVLELMRDVIHHVADEETVLIPAAERLLADRLDELGAEMTQLRFKLTTPHAGEIAANSVRGMPATTMIAAGGALLVGSWVLKRAFERRV